MTTSACTWYGTCYISLAKKAMRKGKTVSIYKQLYNLRLWTEFGLSSHCHSPRMTTDEDKCTLSSCVLQRQSISWVISVTWWHIGYDICERYILRGSAVWLCGVWTQMGIRQSTQSVNNWCCICPQLFPQHHPCICSRDNPADKYTR